MTESQSWLPLQFEPGLVSVIIPAFNRAEMLRETLESVFRQEYRPIEIIVANDGSTDGTLAMLETLKPPEGITLEISKGKHAGAAAARNRGARLSHGEFILFLDSDDVLHEGALGGLVAGLGKADLVYGWWRDWYSRETPPRFGRTYRREPGGDLLVSLLRNDWLLPSATLHRRASLRRVQGWDESFSVQDDHEFMCRVALGGATAAVVKRLVTDYRKHGENQLSLTSAMDTSMANEIVLRRVESALDEQGWTHERRLALAWRWFREARKAWHNDIGRARFDQLIGEVKRVAPGFRAPKLWYRILAAVVGYRNTERLAGVARKLVR
ncbi:MAG: glycosyltransferase [Planctomycetes bacterium]|nr:glycosyltransferase [Planctomycetota bacterium]